MASPEALAESLYYEATCALHSGDPVAAAAGYRRCMEIRKGLATDPKATIARVNLLIAWPVAAITHAPRRSPVRFWRPASKMSRCTSSSPAATRWPQGPPTRNGVVSSQRSGPLRPDRRRIDAALVRGLYRLRRLDCLRKAKQRGWTDVVRLEIDPDLEPIRNDPAFRTLIAEFPRPGAKTAVTATPARPVAGRPAMGSSSSQRQGQERADGPAVRLLQGEEDLEDRQGRPRVHVFPRDGEPVSAVMDRDLRVVRPVLLRAHEEIARR